MLSFDNYETDACNHCIPQFYGMGGIDIGWTDYFAMLIHGPMMPEPNLIPGSGMRHQKSLIVLPFDNYETDACNHCIPQFYGMGGIDIGWTNYLVMLIGEKTRQFLIGLLSKPVRIILTGFLHTQLQECTQTFTDITCWRKPVRIILIGIY